MAGAAWHLIAGSTGAGKTTYARELATTLGGLVFSIDEWMNSLFWPDAPEKNDLPWALERIRRCEDQAAAIGSQLHTRNTDAIFDMGLTTQALRERWLERARTGGIPVVLHVLDLPRDLRWQRVQARNAAATGTFAFHITPEMFALVEGMWQRPDPAECTLYSSVHWL